MKNLKLEGDYADDLIDTGIWGYLDGDDDFSDFDG